MEQVCEKVTKAEWFHPRQHVTSLSLLKRSPPKVCNNKFRIACQFLRSSSCSSSLHDFVITTSWSDREGDLDIKCLTPLSNF